jgi:hypothetical protein
MINIALKSTLRTTLEWGVGSGEWGVGSGEWGSGEWGIGSGEWGVRIANLAMKANTINFASLLTPIRNCG